MMYLDANFFVFAVLDTSKKGEKARVIQKNIIDGKISAFTSVLAIDEIMWVLRRNNKLHLLREVIEDIYSIPNLEIKEVQALIPLRAIDFMEKYNLKPRDSIHLAVMEHLQLNKIVSDDSDFDKIKNINRIKLE